MTDRNDVLPDGVDAALLGNVEDSGIHVGVDRVELAEFRQILAAGGDEFLGTVYTDSERDHCGGRVERLATRFVAKEAATKALGTGLRGVGPREIEVVSEANGQPRLQLHGRARERAMALRIKSMSVSLTHTSTAAEAFVVAVAADATATDSSPGKESRL